MVEVCWGEEEKKRERARSARRGPHFSHPLPQPRARDPRGLARVVSTRCCVLFLFFAVPRLFRREADRCEAGESRWPVAWSVALFSHARTGFPGGGEPRHAVVRRSRGWVAAPPALLLRCGRAGRRAPVALCAAAAAAPSVRSMWLFGSRRRGPLGGPGSSGVLSVTGRAAAGSGVRPGRSPFQFASRRRRGVAPPAAGGAS